MAPRAHGIDVVRSWLDERGISYEVIEHDETFSAVEEAEATGVPSGFMAKTLVLHDRAAYLLAVIPASRRLDERRMREVLGASSHLRLATEDEIGEEFLGFDIGALPPFGPLLPAAEIVDVRLLYHDRVVCAGGDHGHSLALDPRELVRVVEPRVADVCEHETPRHDEDFGELRGV